MSIFRRFIPSNEIIPFPWGISNREYCRDGAWCWWVPLNLVVRYASNLWYRLAIPRRFTAKEDATILKGMVAELERKNRRLQTMLEVETDGKECVERSYVRAIAEIARLRAKQEPPHAP